MFPSHDQWGDFDEYPSNYTITCDGFVHFSIQARGGWLDNTQIFNMPDEYKPDYNVMIVGGNTKGPDFGAILTITDEGVVSIGSMRPSGPSLTLIDGDALVSFSGSYKL